MCECDCPECGCNDCHALPEALNSISRAIRDLGNANAGTPMGALEALSVRIGDALDGIAQATRSE
jgi:hypothetical protein